MAASSLFISQEIHTTVNYNSVCPDKTTFIQYIISPNGRRQPYEAQYPGHALKAPLPERDEGGLGFRICLQQTIGCNADNIIVIPTLPSGSQQHSSNSKQKILSACFLNMRTRSELKQ